MEAENGPDRSPTEGRRKHARRSLFLVALCSLAACEGESRVERWDFGDVPPVSVENLAEASAAALCEPLEHCCGTWGFPYDRAGCEAALEADFAPAVALIEGGGARLDETEARRCIADLAASLANCRLESSASCRRALVGTAPLDQSCATSEECDEPDDGEALCSEGTCSFRSRARLGESCSYTCREEMEIWSGFWPALSWSSCDFVNLPMRPTYCYRNDDLFCSRSTGRCERLLGEGSACEPGECQMHLHCGDGTCRPRGYPGEICASGNVSSVEPPCVDGSRCAEDDRCELWDGSGPLFDPAVTCSGTSSE